MAYLKNLDDKIKMYKADGKYKDDKIIIISEEQGHKLVYDGYVEKYVFTAGNKNVSFDDKYIKERILILQNTNTDAFSKYVILNANADRDVTGMVGFKKIKRFLTSAAKGKIGVLFFNMHPGHFYIYVLSVSGLVKPLRLTDNTLISDIINDNDIYKCSPTVAANVAPLVEDKDEVKVAPLLEEAKDPDFENLLDLFDQVVLPPIDSNQQKEIDQYSAILEAFIKTLDDGNPVEAGPAPE
jgi:hypothetical protein